MPVTEISGIGLWNSWTRNFSSPLLAALDLIDNAFDAADPHHGKLYVDADVSEKDNVRGIVMTNNCRNKVKDLADVVLKAYNSSKTARKDDMGENGVGVKQSCATLADISFVLVRNHNSYGLGVLAKTLQTDSGLYLPSFKFQLLNGNEPISVFYEKLTEICDHDKGVKRIIAEYGRADDAQVTDMVALNKGIHQLAQHFMRITDPKGRGLWGSTPYAFSVLVYNPKHGVQEGESEDPSARQQRGTRRASIYQFLRSIREELPKYYLHISESFDCQVDKVPVSFSYWQRRLVEMTQFKIAVHSSKPVTTETIVQPDDLEYAASLDEHLHVLKIYVGFDPIRCANEKVPGSARLLWYSRKAGRLIKEHMDARGELGLSSGGTDYCQGLTILVDDVKGDLPLNPTKHDFAWGTRANGMIFESNLKKWISGATKTFYDFYKAQSDNKKGILTERVNDIETGALALIEKGNGMHPIEDCEFNTFQGLQWTIWREAVRAKQGTGVVHHGRHTSLRLEPFETQPSVVKQTAAGASKKTARARSLDDNMTDGPQPKKQKSEIGKVIKIKDPPPKKAQTSASELKNVKIELAKQKHITRKLQMEHDRVKEKLESTLKYQSGVENQLLRYKLGNEHLDEELKRVKTKAEALEKELELARETIKLLTTSQSNAVDPLSTPSRKLCSFVYSSPLSKCV